MSTGRKVRFAALTAILLAVFSVVTVFHAGQHVSPAPAASADASFCGVCTHSADGVSLSIGPAIRLVHVQPLPAHASGAAPAPDVRGSSSRGPPPSLA